MDEAASRAPTMERNWKQLWPLKHTDDLSGHNWRMAVNERMETRVSSPPARLEHGQAAAIIRSEDDGNTFTVIREGIPNYVLMPNTMWGRGYPRALAVDPNDPQVVYLGIDGDPEPARWAAAFSSRSMAAPPGNSSPPSPEAAGCSSVSRWTRPIQPRLLGRVRQWRGVWRSNDGGESWEQVFRNEVFIWNVVVASDGTIYCSGEQLWRSKDQGKTWTRLTTSPRNHVPWFGIEVHPNQSQHHLGLAHQLGQPPARLDPQDHRRR